MKKIYNVIFPIWLILILPPIVLLVITSNFIIDSLVLILCFRLLKMDNLIKKYRDTILKVWIFGFIIDVFGSLLLLITQFLPSSKYLTDNLIYPVAWNPFKSGLGFLYVLMVVVICGILIYFINYKFSFKNLEDTKNKKIIALVLSVITAPYLFFLPTSYFYSGMDNNLEKYQDSYIGDNSSVGNILNQIYSGKYYDTFSLETKEEPYGIIIKYKESTYGDIYKDIEKDALILFKLIKNIGFVEFEIGDKSYVFDNDYVTNIFEDIKDKKLDDIYERYDSEYMNKFSYLGHIDAYDIFDTSTVCDIDEKIIYEDSKYNYFVTCSDIDSLYLVNDDAKIKLFYTKTTVEILSFYKCF